MNKLFCCFVFATVVVLYANYGFALLCYECNSHFNPECYSNPAGNKSFLVDCGDNGTVCRKIHQQVNFEEGGLDVPLCHVQGRPLGAALKMGPDDRIIRYCGHNQTAGRSEKPCVNEIGLGTQETVCTCNTDKCNSAQHVTLDSILVAMTSIISLLCIRW